MSTSKKKAVAKTPEPKPKYAVGQKVFYISYHRGKPEELTEAKIIKRITSENDELDFLGKKWGVSVHFEYSAFTAIGSQIQCSELMLYPTFQKAAEVFAKSFLTLLK
jgi:hypothetical protein